VIPPESSPEEPGSEATFDDPLPPDEDLRHLPPRLHEGAMLGRYRLEAQLAARPNRPSVWRAWNTVVERTEVLKVYLLADKERSPSIAAETEMALRWSEQPTVVTTYWAGAIDSYWVIAMEELGKTLTEHMEERERDSALWRDQATYVKWIWHIGTALFFIHEEGELHRDVTAGNVMLDPTETVAKLIDFSIGRPEANRGDTTGRRGFVGTPRFVAPEQHDGKDVAESDQYQLGVLAWTLLSGAGVGRDPGRRLTGPLRAVLEHATAIRPDARFRNLPSFTEALRMAAAGSTSRIAIQVEYAPPPLRRLLARIGTLAPMAAILSYTAYHVAPGIEELGTVVAIAAISGTAILLALAGEVLILWQGHVDEDDRRGPKLLLPLYAGVLLALGTAVYVGQNAPHGVQPLIIGVLPALAYLIGTLGYAVAMNAVSEHEGKYVTGLAMSLLGVRGKRRRWLSWAGILVALLAYYFASTAYVTDLRAQEDDPAEAAVPPEPPGREPLKIDVADSGPSNAFLKVHTELVLLVARGGNVTGIDGVMDLRKSATLGAFEQVFGTPAVRQRTSGGCESRWPKIGLVVNSANLGGFDPCGRRPGLVQAFEMHASSATSWETPDGLRPGASATTLRRLYPAAHISRFTTHVALAQAPSPLSESGFAETLGVNLEEGRVTALVAQIGAAGE
jgi:Protein kinase domain